MEYLEFKKFLNKNNIFLFDSNYRIAHYRFNKLQKNPVQIGGSIKNDNLINKLSKLNNNYLLHFINSLLDKNVEKTNYILKSTK